MSVLETQLSEQKAGTNGTWLVGGKISYADLSFVPWTAMLFDSVRMMKEGNLNLEQYPCVKKWYDGMNSRPSVENAMKAAFGQ
jgi:glutathione S-transferase